MPVNKKFWANYANHLKWHKFPNKIFEKISDKPMWFHDGKINVYYNCIIRHIEKGNGKKLAIIYVNKKGEVSRFSYFEISNLVEKFSFFLNKYTKNRNVKIMIHASASIDTTIAMLSCASLGLHFSVVFEELENDALEKRIKLFKPDILFSKKISKKISFKFNKIKSIKLDSYKKLKIFSKKNKLKNFRSTNPLFTLFTSGSTGMPKGITHSSGGYLLFSLYTCKKYFGLKRDSLILTASDAGWINGHTYAIFGPLSIGASTVILEKPTLLLNKNVLISIINMGITILYVPVTLLRIMKSLYGNINLKNLKLKTLGSMGEPLANSVGRWFVKNFGVKNMPIINTYFQTETGGIITSHKFNQKIEQKFYGYVGEPIKSHIKLNYLSNKKKEIKILNSWPGQMINVINSKKHWNEYFDELKNFRMFDYATKKGDNIFIHGRTDDVINIRGHRIGSSEIEAVVLELNSIIECSAICVDDDIEGNIFYLFCKSLTKKISDIEVKIIKNFGTYAIPRKIYFVDEIPKTRSGKIMRRVLRDLVKNPRKAIKSDISTLVNKNILKSISNVIKNT